MFRPVFAPPPLLAIVFALPVLALPAATLAHHGWSAYDATKVIKITAPVSDITWGNPHGAAKVRHEGRTWDVVLAPVTRMEARGLTRAMLASDKPVTLEGYPRKDGVAEMRIERVTVDGKTVELR
ncbi:DUF6152 family protein [Caulobacter sp. RHG1]|uniref:DUF6152 family protein n=1 Tax=Caulobacter sp. (strain RHG1) TaxID=2545762 RepID=UPI001554BFBB|nr:DUF6152 family protein [Caulobacter sp. RHG1]NQE60949.1 hypothetical protein [Caulobacter sp. RHG1]